jgi:signal transduction histidine kinase
MESVEHRLPAEERTALRRLADQQAALRRVATLVAKNVTAAELLKGVALEVSHVVGVQDVVIERFEEDRATVIVASLDEDAWPVGTRWALDGPGCSATVHDTGQSARFDDYSNLPGTVADFVRRVRIRASVGVPIALDGRLWGVMCACAREDETMPDDTVERLSEFTDLVATAIANAESRDGLRRLAALQTALRHLATLVAERTPAADFYAAVAEEAARVLDVATVGLARYDAGRMNTILASLDHAPFPVGSTWPLEGESVCTGVFDSGRPVRIDDYSALPGPIAAATRSSPFTSCVGAPIVVDGVVWGVLTVSDRKRLRDGIENELLDFTEIVATAVSDATTHAELMASRSRLVTAGDEARRRIERNLHDGTQQRLVTIDIGLRALESKISADNPEALEAVERIRDDVRAVIEEVREVSRGLHPSALAEAGLEASLRSLARRTGIGVDFDVELPTRPPEPIEIGVYYLVSEALTNIVRHAQAGSVTIEISAADSLLRVAVADDGVGGAEIGRGSGLEGLVDRVEALGGWLEIDSPPAGGTRLLAVFPIGPGGT